MYSLISALLVLLLLFHTTPVGRYLLVYFCSDIYGLGDDSSNIFPLTLLIIIFLFLLLFFDIGYPFSTNTRGTVLIAVL